MDLQEKASSVGTRIEMADFVEELLADLQANSNEWGHTTLEGFLGVLADSFRVLDRIYWNEGRDLPEAPQWSVFAEALMAARIRE